MNQLSIFAEVGGVNMLPKWLFIVGFTTLLVYCSDKSAPKWQQPNGV